VADITRVLRKFPAVAEYLSNIYIIQRDYGEVRNSRLASWTGVSGSAVTQAVGRLKRLGLVRQKRYGVAVLTDEGRKLALKVLRRHYLLEHLLVRILDYPWEKADGEAKLLQGQISDDLTEHLFLSLGSPQTCPHGNPLPGTPIEGKLLNAPRLSEAPVGRVVLIVRITEEGEQIPSMLALCHETGLEPGTRFRVTQKDGSSVRLRPEGRESRRPRKTGVPQEKTAVALGESRGGTGRDGTRADVVLPLDRCAHIRYEPA
jgi:DtxR family Mn-dependent transcriptional regulator